MRYKFAFIIPNCFLLFGLISCIDYAPSKNIEHFWINDLMNYILHNTSTYQTIIITDKQESRSADGNVDSILDQIPQKLPVMFLDMNYLIQFARLDNSLCDFIHFEKSNAFFVYVNTFGYSLSGYSQKVAETLRWLSCDSQDPKILMIQIRDTNPNLKQELRYAWQKKILDFTIVVVIRNKRSFFLPEMFSEPLYFVHRFNPFTEEYTNEEYKSGFEFFPRKLKNMNRYKLKTSMIHSPPGSHLIKNSFGQVVDVAGTEGMTLKALEKTLNFKAEMITSKVDSFGKILPNGSGTLIFKKLQDGEIEFISSGAYVFRSPMHKRVERTTAVRVDKFCTLVPIIPVEKMLLTPNAYQALLVTVGVVFIVWITTLLLKFDPELMDPLKLVCMLMTVPMSIEPSKLIERIIFGACLIVSLAYSSTVFAELTDILVQTKGEVPFENLEDLDESGLHLLMHPNLINNTFVGAEHDQTLLSLQRKTTEYLLTNQCPDILLKYRNVSCSGTESWSQMVVQMTRKHDEYTMKLAKPCFWSATMAFVLQKGSPYLYTFNDIISRVGESGLRQKWFDNYTMQVMFEAARKRGPYKKQEERNQLAQQLWTVIYYGSLISFITFIGEFILFRIHKISKQIIARLKMRGG